MCSLFSHVVFCDLSFFVITLIFLTFFTPCIEIVSLRKKVVNVKVKITCYIVLKWYRALFTVLYVFTMNKTSSYWSETLYVSCIKINGKPILPPLVSFE
jgi:hypothetical protein